MASAGGMRDPGDVLAGVQSHIRGHAREEEVVRRAQGGYRNGFSFQVADRPHVVRPEDLVAADMDPSQEDDRLSRVHLDDERCHEGDGEIKLAGGQSLIELVHLDLDVLHLSESLAKQQFFGHVLGGYTDPDDLGQPDLRPLGRYLGGNSSGIFADHACRPRKREPS
jgi:hypothetical protein